MEKYARNFIYLGFDSSEMIKRFFTEDDIDVIDWGAKKNSKRKFLKWLNSLQNNR